VIAKIVRKKAWLLGENTDHVVLRKKLKRAVQRGELIGKCKNGEYRGSGR
jgi:hypothetical protein